MHLNSFPMKFRGQGHLVTLANGHLFVICYHFKRTAPLKLLGSFQFNFVCILQAKEKESIYKFGPGHMTNIVAMLLYGRSLTASPSAELLGKLP